MTHSRCCSCKKLNLSDTDTCFHLCVYFYLNSCYSFSWYDEHLKECEGGNDEESRIRIVLLTDDKKNNEKAKLEGVISYTGRYMCIFGVLFKHVLEIIIGI